MDRTKNLYDICNLYVVLLYALIAVILEVTQFLFCNIGLFPKYASYDLSFLLIISGILLIMPQLLAKQIVICILIVAQTILNIVNVILFRVFGSILTINMCKLGVEAKTAFSFSFINIPNLLLNLLIMSLGIAFVFIMPKKTGKKLLINKSSKYAFMLVFFIVFEYIGLFAYGVSVKNLVSVDDSIIGNDEYLYQTTYLPTESYKKFGTFGYYTKALGNILMKTGVAEGEELDKIKLELSEGKNFYENDLMTGKLENYNVISILLESFDTFAINPYFTPTMYDLATKSGVSFKNFYGRNKTNVSELISIIGNSASEKLLSDFNTTVGIDTPYSLPELIKKDAQSKNQTVETGFFHSNVASFYNRDTTHPQLGFDKVYGTLEIYGYNPTNCFDDRVFDCDCFEKAIDYVMPTNVDRFYSQITTFSTHGSYDYNIDAFSGYEKYVNENYSQYCQWLIDNGYVPPVDLKFENEFKVYLARTIDVDNMISMLLEKLHERGLIDKTLIVMYADHAPYYNDLGNLIKGYSKDDFESPILNNIPFIMFANGLTPEISEKFCSHYSIYPTICDLLNLPYNSAITQGRSVFASDEERLSLFVSFLGGMYNQYFYSSNIVDVVECKVIEDESIRVNAVKRFKSDAEKFYLRQQLIEQVWANNIYSRIEIN